MLLCSFYLTCSNDYTVRYDHIRLYDRYVYRTDMTNLFVDIETVPDFTIDEYHKLSVKVKSGEITQKSDYDLYWKFTHGALSPFNGKVIFIKYQISDKGNMHSLMEWESSEADILKKFYDVVASLQSGPNQGTRIIGHNIAKFDIPFLYERMRMHETASIARLHLKMIRQPLIVDFLQLHLALNSMTARGLKHDVLAHAYGLPTKSTRGDSEIIHYFNKEYDKIIDYSSREFIYPQLYSIISDNGTISAEKLEESKLWYDKLHADDSKVSL